MQETSILDIRDENTRLNILRALKYALDGQQHYSSIEEVKKIERMGVPVSDLGRVFSGYLSYIPFVKSLRNVY